MLSNRIRESLSVFVEAVNRAAPLTALLSALAAHHREVIAYVSAMAKGGDSLVSSANAAHSLINRTQLVMRELSARQAFAALDRLLDEISDLQELGLDGSEGNVFSELVQVLNDFGTALDSQIVNPTGPFSWRLLQAAHVADCQMKVAFGFCELFGSLLDAGYTCPKDNESAMQVVLPAKDIELKDLNQRLGAICAIYSELIRLLQLSEDEHPLRLDKVETGSLLVRVFGHPQVIQLLVGFVSSVTTYAYTTNTDQGQLERVLPLKIEAVERAIKLRESLENAGLPTDGIDRGIEDSSRVIGENLSTLLAGQPSVTVNGDRRSASGQILIGHDAQRSPQDDLTRPSKKGRSPR